MSSVSALPRVPAEHIFEMEMGPGDSSAGTVEKKECVLAHKKGQRLWFTDRTII